MGAFEGEFRQKKQNNAGFFLKDLLKIIQSDPNNGITQLFS